MDFNKLLPVVGEVNEESLERLANEMKRQIEEEDLDFDNMEKKVQGQISLENRKYGRGAVLLGPYGYFYPEQMLGGQYESGKAAEESGKGLIHL